jgi:hypothetical protein
VKRWILEVSFSLPTGDEIDQYDFVLTDALKDALLRYGCTHLEGKFETMVWPDCGEEDCDSEHGEVQGRTERFEYQGTSALDDKENDQLYVAVEACQLFGDIMHLNIQDAETGERALEWSAFDPDGDGTPDDPGAADAVLARALNLQ